MYAKQENSMSHVDNPIRWSYRDIPLSHAKHVCGRVAWTPPPQAVPVESQLEAQVLDFLIRHRHLVAVHSQPFTLRYWDGQQLRQYTPDFLVVYDPVSRALIKLGFEPWTVVEVKPSSRRDAHPSELARRLQAVHDLLGLGAVCLTERDLQPGRA
jgi:hypothetical protein